MFELLRQRQLRRFFLAHGQSQLGTGAAYVALVLVAYQRLHSGWAIALVLLADFLPAVVLSPCFGVLADRWSRRTLAIVADLMRAGSFGALALTGSFVATVALALLAGAGSALFRPTVNAALPTLVSSEQRSRATALYGGLQNLGFTAGPALCGLVLMFAPATAVLLVNAATFLVSGALLAGVSLDAPVAVAGSAAGAASGAAADEGDRPSAWQDAKEGARYAARERRIGALILIGAVTVLCAAIINVAEPLLAIGPLHAGGSGFSILIMVFGAGMVAGSAYTARLGSRVEVLRAHFLGGVGLSAVAMLTCAGAGSLAWALGPFALFGFANSLILGPEIRLVQELTPERLQGRVFGLRDSIECACFAAAFIAAGGLLGAIGPRGMYVLSGVLLVGATTLGIVVFRLPRAGAGAGAEARAERRASEPALAAGEAA